MSVYSNAESSLPFHLLEITVISAQDLAPISKTSMRTYAVAYIDPERKLTTRVDTEGHTNPTWNDKFVFRATDVFLRSETAAITVEINAIRLLGHAPVGVVRVLISTLFPSLQATSARFVALQIRRPSGRPQGILNLGVALLNPSMRSMPIYNNDLCTPTAAVTGFRTVAQIDFPISDKPKLRRVKSECRSEMTESEFGPAPSFDGSKHQDDFYANETGSSILEDWSVASSGGGKELLKLKLEKWRTELPPIYDRDRGFGSFRSNEPTRRASSEPTRRVASNDGGNGKGGLFSCFGPYGCECSIFCGSNPNRKPET